jgi:hypothetical protein
MSFPRRLRPHDDYLDFRNGFAKAAALIPAPPLQPLMQINIRRGWSGTVIVPDKGYFAWTPPIANGRG